MYLLYNYNPGSGLYLETCAPHGPVTLPESPFAATMLDSIDLRLT